MRQSDRITTIDRPMIKIVCSDSYTLVHPATIEDMLKYRRGHGTMARKLAPSRP
ncbi:MAG: hypothetical protein Q8Q42_01145 [Nanoarchaeota archaeon]|nr:hypothetical protein [Nanoarchaeota archaeon]